MVDVSADQTTHLVANLEEGNEYKFRVLAKNKAGPGMSCETQSVVTKPPYGMLIWKRGCNILKNFHQNKDKVMKCNCGTIFRTC